MKITLSCSASLRNFWRWVFQKIGRLIRSRTQKLRFNLMRGNKEYLERLKLDLIRSLML